MLYLCCPVENRARYPLDFAAVTCYIEPKPNNERGRFMAAVTLPTHYRNVFAEQGYAQAEIDARIENANYGSAIDHLKYRHDEFHLVPVLDESGNIAGRNFIENARTKNISEIHVQ